MEADAVEPIAIIGMSVKFPQDATSPEAFWDMLEAGRSAASKVPVDRFNVDAFYHSDPSRLDSLRVKEAHFMAEDPRAFDAPFFNMSPAEASVLDPQQRGLLEGAYHCLENAGIATPTLAGTSTSVFVACFGRDHDAYIARDVEGATSRYHATGSGSSMLANRISHAFDLRGASITVDTACSAGLSAFHLACQSVRAGESRMALVCGGNTYMAPESLSIPLDDAGFLSPDGRCWSFDARANGYARGEGFGCVLIKPLKAALEDGNIVRAVVRATGVNQDGRTPSITQPSPDAQIGLIRRTYEVAGLDLATTNYVEAHGTGTAVGDPIEARAIGSVFREHRAGRPLHIGSVKSNIGHLEGASGLAGIIKTVLVLERGIIPPICNFETANPAIDAKELCLQFDKMATPWPSPGLRRASVSSFGYGGSNGHAILEDACNYLRLRGLKGLHNTVDLASTIQTVSLASRNPSRSSSGSPSPIKSEESDAETGRALWDGSGSLSPPTPRTPTSDLASSPASASPLPRHAVLSSDKKGIIVLSAADQNGPARLADSLLPYLTSHQPKQELRDILYTLSKHRTAHSWRSFSIIDAETLQPTPGEAFPSSAISPAVRAGHVPPTACFVFTGQGAQWARMGLSLLHLGAFEQSLRAADDHLCALGCEWSLLDELRTPEGKSRVQEPAFSQPLCTAVQVALVDLLRSWGVRPASVCGHSSGELAAAYCTGALSREEAWGYAYFRGVVSQKLAQSAGGGMGMLSVGLGEKAALAYLQQEGVADLVSVGCVNSPINVTLTGDAEAIDKLWRRFDADEVFVRKLAVTVAYHSKYMAQVADEYLGLIKSHRHKQTLAEEAPGQFPVMFSSVTGHEISGSELRQPEYWVRNLVGTVRFSQALSVAITVSQQTATEDGNKTSRSTSNHFIVEIGPQAALRRPVQDTLTPLLGKDKWQYAPVLDARNESLMPILAAMGRLWCAGADVDLAMVNEACLSTPTDAPPKMVVDLPTYPFSRAKLFWEESRLSRRFAHRKHRRHCLVGLRARDFNPDEASWRHIIRYSENPWILDHTLNGSPIYPGSGMIVMAIEGVRQLIMDSETFDESLIAGYKIANVRFLRAISVDDSDRGVEAQLHMRPRRDNINNTLQKWYDWRVFTQSGGSSDDWLEAAYGSIQVEVVTNNNRDEHKRRAAAEVQAQHDAVLDACKFKTYPDQMYGNMAALGLDYGPFFARLEDIQYSKEGHAAATLGLRDYEDKMPYAHEDPCVVHPTTLDALCHLQMAALSAGGLRPIPTMMFTHCREMWVSSALLNLPANARVTAASTQTMRGYRECEFDTVALLLGDENERSVGAASREPMVIIRGERGTAITSLDEAAGSVPGGAVFDTACYNLEFRPDLSLLDNEAAYKYLMANTFRPFALPDRDHIDRADAMSIHYVETVLQRLDSDLSGLVKMPFGDHRDEYVQWMRRTLLRKHDYTPETRGRTDLDTKKLVQGPESAITEPTQRLVRKVGDNLYDLLTGQADVHEVIFGGRLVDDFYSAEMFKIHANRVGAYVEILAHSNPALRILEVGAGTGSSAAGVLPFLTYDQGNGQKMMRIDEYMYTDISAGFFEHARERFSDYVDSGVLKFNLLDLEKDPLIQPGFEEAEGTYDCIIAGNVVHATSDIHTSLRSVRRLLKPGGKFIMVEICNPYSVREGLIFGLLDGWWLRARREGASHTYPHQGPLLTEAQWSTALAEAGFSGVDLELRDHDDLPYHRLSTLVATAVPAQEEPPTLPPPVYIVVDGESKSQCQAKFAQKLEQAIVARNLASTVSTVTLDEIENETAGGLNLKTVHVISLIELDKGILERPNDKQLLAIRNVALKSGRLLWITSGGGPRSSNPEAELSIGLGRTVCSERGDQGFIVASLESAPSLDGGSSVDHTVQLITSLLKEVQNSHDGDKIESELAEVDGVFQIPRVAPNGRLNDAVATRIAARQHDMASCTIGAATAHLQHIELSIGNPGLLDTLMFKEKPHGQGADAALEPGEVEIQVMASSINFKDVMIALGQIPGSGFGFDGAGIVTRVGPRAQTDSSGQGEDTRVQPGDRVMFVSVTGAFSTFVRVSELQTHPMPDAMSFNVAASIPVVYCTALYSLDYVARIRPGESVLIHAGAGGVGQAAIMIAKKRGAIIYVTAGSQVKRDLLTDVYGVPPEHIFNSRDASFVEDIMRITGGKGVDVVLNSLGGELLQQSWKCIKIFGRFIEIGKADILQNTGLGMAPFDRNVTFSAVDLIVVVENSKELMKDVMTDVMKLWEDFPDDVHEPRPLHVYPATQFEEAMRYLQSGKNTGKTVIDWSGQGEVQYRPCLKPAYQFRSDSTYVLAGGLGGLPQAMVRWMISRGARYFMLISRSGAKGHAKSEKFLQEVARLGATVITPTCDISDRSALQRVLTEHTLPPIRGCIQGAMVLHDELMENMTAEVWNDPLEAKVRGSRNLAELLPPDLDFLVMLSSFAGVIGNRGQSNYAAGNTYQDALARNRVKHHKQRVVSVNLGLVLETGSANDNLLFVKSTLRAGFSGVTQDQLLGLLDVVCDPSYDYEAPWAAQVVHVVDSPKMLWEKGHTSVVGWMTKPLFRNLHRIGAMYESQSASAGAGAGEKTAQVNYLAEAREAGARSVEEAGEVVLNGLLSKLAKSLSVPLADLDPGQAAFKVGVDSLIAVEVRYWFMKQFGVEVAVFNILKDQSMVDLCHSVAVEIMKKG